MKHPGLAAVILPVLFLLSSCIGISMDITLKRDGSGTVTLEYMVSQALESLGRLDGNERWNTIPVGRADFERTMDRLPGMKLLSFSSREFGKDLAINAKMEFVNLPSLMAFLDAGGLRSYLHGDAARGRLFLTLSEGTGIKTPALDKLIADISASYFVRMSMTFPTEGSLNLTDAKGISIQALPESFINPRGEQVSFDIPLYEVLSSAEGINVEFSW
jgi:hypothetical protein